jgi:flagellar P-ring protein precursor FlgI
MALLMRRIVSLALGALILMALASPALGARLKEITRIRGVRDNQLTGYGLVVGLKGSGDKQQVTFTMQALANLAERLGGIKVAANTLRVQNVATVLVTAELPPFATMGSKVDVLISSVGDCQSLVGGTLLMTTLKGVDGEVYALAQGPVIIGGFSAGGGAGGGAQKNHTTVGRIAEPLVLALNQADFTTAERIATAINTHLGGSFAKAVDSGRVMLDVPPAYRQKPALLLAEVERLEVAPDQVAKVVLDERTGTVVMGENVRISTLAVAHGNLSITIKEKLEVSQPQPLATGQTVVTPETEVQVQESEQRLVMVPAAVSIGEVVRGLNAIGVTPRDLITIFQAIKAAGALQAELEVI